MAMAIGINSGGNLSNPNFRSINKSNQFCSSNPILPISNQTQKFSQTHVYVPKTIRNSSIVTPPSDKSLMPNWKNSKRDVNFSEKIESWMQSSVSDIVKNLKQAPLLVQIYSEDDDDDGRVKVTMEKVLLEDWPYVRSDWENGKSKSPDGLIFVEELKQDSEIVDQDSEKGVAKAWGIVVQGKGVECGPSCYLLKTNRVCAGFGLGFCTHFCLMRVNNFRDSALEQFQDSWLLQ